MMRLYIVLILFAGHLKAQVNTIKIKSADTINYMYLYSAKGYNLKKVMDLSNTVVHKCRKELRVYTPLDSFWVKEARKKANKQLKINDTLMSVRWYLIKRTECMSEYCGHADEFWKLTVNQKSNVLILEKVLCAKGLEVDKLLFKVIKLSEFEIILEDMGDKVWHRRYTFQKNDQ